MTDDLMTQFAHMQSYTAALHGLITEAQARAPQHSEGADQSNAVRVVLGPDGLPTSFRVQRDWNRRIEPAAFGGAVLEACQAALGERLAAWTRTLQDHGWKARADRLHGGLDDPAARLEQGRVPLAFGHPGPAVRPRPLGDVTEDVFTAFDNVSRLTQQPPPPARGTGSAGGGKLTITLSSTGLTSCGADPRWVSHQTAAQLMNALSAALCAAKQDLASTPPSPAPASGLDRLLAEALALLNDPRRLAE